jgi:hypothetical protein
MIDGTLRLFVYGVAYSQTDLNYTRVIANDWSLSAGISYQRNKFSPDVVSDDFYKVNNDELSYKKTSFYCSRRSCFGKKAQIEHTFF